MAKVKAGTLRKLSKQERENKMKDLKLDLMKSKTGSNTGNTKEIKRAIARLLTLNNEKIQPSKKKEKEEIK